MNICIDVRFSYMVLGGIFACGTGVIYYVAYFKMEKMLSAFSRSMFFILANQRGLIENRFGRMCIFGYMARTLVFPAKLLRTRGVDVDDYLEFPFGLKVLIITPVYFNVVIFLLMLVLLVYEKINIFMRLI